MGAEQVRLYLAAKQRMADAEVAADAMVKIVVDGAGLLAKDWRTVFVDPLCTTRLPNDWLWNNPRKILAREWPSAETIADTIAHWYDAQRDIHLTWHQLTAEEQAQCHQPPPPG